MDPLLLFVFVLAGFLGVELIAKVPSQLHTPLMSGTNAISGIIAIGGMLSLHDFGKHDDGEMVASSILGGIAPFLACINIFGGFFITYRMLSMFHD